MVVWPAIAAAGRGVNISATEGISFTGRVANIDSCVFGSAIIDWGDGTSTAGALDSSGSTPGVKGTHTYAEEGTYSGTVTYSTDCTPNGTVTFVATVADAGLSAVGVDVSATARQSFTGVVSHFFDADPQGTVNDYGAQIAWGDGSHSAGTISSSPSGGFDVTGTHTYQSAGQATVDVTITDLGGSSAHSSSTATLGSSTPSPDFTLTPASGAVVVVPGGTATDSIGITRMNGSRGSIAFGFSRSSVAPPPGVHVQFSPNPASGDSTLLTVSADANAPATMGETTKVTFQGTPQSPTAGSSPHSFTIQILVQGCFHVSTGQELVYALNTGYKCIFVNNDARIDLGKIQPMEPDCPPPAPNNIAMGPPPQQRCAVLRIPDGVTLESGRSAVNQGGLLYLDRQLPQSFMLDLGSNTHITGLRIEGYDPRDTSDPLAKRHPESTAAIQIGGTYTVCSSGCDMPVLRNNILIDNNDIGGWPTAGIGVASNGTTIGTAEQVRITNNFIHDNLSCEGGGYGVIVGADFGVGTAHAYIDRNVFEDNRHDIAGGGQSMTGYDADQNFTLYKGPTCDGNYNQHFDMHGTGTSGGHYGGDAGDYTEIMQNTFRGAQTYGSIFKRQTRPAFELRGTPADKAVFADNVLSHSNESEALKVCDPKCGGAAAQSLERQQKLSVYGNQYNVDTELQLAVGDFDGDHHDGVFQATGAGWWYSPWARSQWRFLKADTHRLNQLALGDFNGDGKTDVFTRSGDQWLVSYGGTGPWTPLPFGSSIPMSQYRFYDLAGDGKTGIFRIGSGGQWWYSDGGAKPWKPLESSSLKLNALRFCDFTGKGKTDVFSLANHQWSVSYGGATPWQRLNKELSSNLNELVFADFNGDGKCDIARSHNGEWQVSWGGTTPWRVLRPHANEELSAELIGNFTGSRRADVLDFNYRSGSGFLARPRWLISVGGRTGFFTWSWGDMS